MKACFSILLTALTLISFAQTEKKILSHDDYDNWKALKSQKISDDGRIVTYEINKQLGDGKLYIYNTETTVEMAIDRGRNAKVPSESKFVAFNIYPQYDSLRAKKLKKVKKDMLPKDSLGIYHFEKDTIYKFARVKSFKIAEDNAEWMVFLHEKLDDVKKDTARNDTTVNTESEKKKTKKDKAKKEGTKLVAFNVNTNISFEFENVESYDISKDGSYIAYFCSTKDSIDSTSVHLFDTDKQLAATIRNQNGYTKKLILDEKGNQLAYLFTEDTAKNKLYNLHYYNIKKQDDKIIKPQNIPEEWWISEHAGIYFSESGKRLYYGTGLKPEPEVKDTLTEDEKVSVDIWNWKDKQLQPQQLKQLSQEKKRSYIGFYDIASEKSLQLADPNVRSVYTDKKHDKKYAIGYNRQPYLRQGSWDADRYQDIYLVNLENGSKQLILKKVSYGVTLSPDQQYLIWYNINDSSWNSYEISTGKRNNLTKSINSIFYDEEFDMAFAPYPYGIMGWTKKDKSVLIYDRFDIWEIDPKGENEAVCLNGQYGLKNNIQFRYVKLDREEEYIDLKEGILLKAFHEKNKQSGFFHYKQGSQLTKLLMGDWAYSTPVMAQDAEELIWTKGSFTVYPDLWISQPDFSEARQISNANPQQSEYLWGNVELVEWTSLDGIDLQGLLYKPENFNPDRKYPMLVYFYETYSNRLHSHHTPKPSRSTINFSYYSSNGYIIFVPDIKYKIGFPGKSAFNCIMSGVNYLVDTYNYIDKSKMALQGQSWGGYQTAYLVTQTDLFAAAMAGAPVSNMTSAYGGIRWGSGMSRMFQYEETQSRIGGTLWEKPWLYIENSPLFHAPNITTPLLIMHNDKDGAVPWYQGIELFVALRRLDKPTWMLVYNGAPHNLSRRADSKDLSVRMQQFFDHYLKDAPAPKWMEEGVPAIDKGRNFGFELIK